jgi:hypothetical protein
MCFPRYILYMLLAVIVGMLVILAVFYHRPFYYIPAFVFAIVWSRVRCIKCEQSLLKDSSGLYLFRMRSICRHCGQDAMLCDVEPDEVTQARLR